MTAKCLQLFFCGLIDLEVCVNVGKTLVVSGDGRYYSKDAIQVCLSTILCDFSSCNNCFSLTCLDMWRICYMISCKPDPIFLPASSLVHMSQVFVFLAICYDKMSLNLCQIPYSISST